MSMLRKTSSATTTWSVVALSCRRRSLSRRISLALNEPPPRGLNLPEIGFRMLQYWTKSGIRTTSTPQNPPSKKVLLIAPKLEERGGGGNEADVGGEAHPRGRKNRQNRDFFDS